jgi:hypothetical protein
VFVFGDRQEINVRYEVTYPIRDMEDILQADCVTLFAPWLSSYLDLDSANPADRDLPLICYGEDVGMKGYIGLEGGPVKSNVDVRRA